MDLSEDAVKLKREIAKKRAETEVGTQGGVKTPSPGSNVSDPSRVGTRSPTGPGSGAECDRVPCLQGKYSEYLAFFGRFPERPP